jgi:hypothetical protein
MQVAEIEIDQADQQEFLRYAEGLNIPRWSMRPYRPGTGGYQPDDYLLLSPAAHSPMTLPVISCLGDTMTAVFHNAVFFFFSQTWSRNPEEVKIAMIKRMLKI